MTHWAVSSEMAVTGVQGGGVPDFGRSVHPISSRGGGGQIMPTTLLLAPFPPDFQTFRHPCVCTSDAALGNVYLRNSGKANVTR